MTSPSLLGWAADRGFWPPMLLGGAQVATAAFVDDLDRGAGALAVALCAVGASLRLAARYAPGCDLPIATILAVAAATLPEPMTRGVWPAPEEFDLSDHGPLTAVLVPRA